MKISPQVAEAPLFTRCWQRSTEAAEMLNSIALGHPLPRLLKTDNGAKFAGKILEKWVYERGNLIDFPRPRTPTDNATVESFNGWLH